MGGVAGERESIVGSFSDATNHRLIGNLLRLDLLRLGKTLSSR